VRQRGMRVRLDDALHPEGIVVAGQPIKLSASGPQTYRPAPQSGADTEAVRVEFLSDVIVRE
jgi:crotonobetainyl-CoA:carnitine CoA-transferase CaiB-like acyl-CoA transferase